MSVKSFLQRLKNFFSADSWIDLFAQWLHSLPLPYWLTCVILWLFTAIGMSANSLFATKETESAIAYFVISFVFSYELYIVWYLEKDTNDLINNHEITPPTATKPRILTTMLKLISLLMRISFSLFILLILFALLMGLSEISSTTNGFAEVLETLEAGVGLPIWFLLFYMIFYIASKIIRTMYLIYRVKWCWCMKI